MKKTLALLAFVSANLAMGAVFAEDGVRPIFPPETSGPGVTSGPAAGAPVEPSTVIQKENPLAQEHSSPEAVAGPSGMAAGSPGVEGAAGTQAGKEWIPPQEIREKVRRHQHMR